ncbi:MAG: tyrosine-type recombinase/integrase [Proteobacteria bacterium]|nr:tyrosine-type recombinase/integrase [Pseudomonadota bacterium]
METYRKKDGAIGYREKVYFNGKAIVSPFFRRQTDAKNWKARTVTERQKQIATGLSYDPKITFGEFANKWFEEKVKGRNASKTQDTYRRELDKHLLPMFEKTSLGAISHTHANLLISELKKKELSNKTTNNVVNTLKAILNVAVKWDYIAKSPLYGFQTLKLNPNTFKFWTDTEISQFLRATLNDPLYPLWVVTVNTGMRKGELLGLCWDRINLSLGRIEITRMFNRYGLHEHTKTYEKRILPINDGVKDIILKLLREQKNPRFVFARPDGRPLDYNHITREFHKAQKKAGITNGIRFHDLRHTFASQFMMHGGNVFTLQKLLGHKSVNMTMKYAHLSEDFLKDAVNVVNFSGEEKTEDSTKTALETKTNLQVVGF